jgi:hypothetical protein
MSRTYGELNRVLVSLEIVFLDDLLKLLLRENLAKVCDDIWFGEIESRRTTHAQPDSIFICICSHNNGHPLKVT